MSDQPSSYWSRRWPRATAFVRHGLLPFILVAVLLAIQFSDPQFRARMRENAFDQLQVLAPLSYHDELPVRVIAIDDESLARVGQWPWPRKMLADVVDRLTQMGAKVIALDIVLAEADRTSPEQVAAQLPNQPALSEQLMRLPTHDQILANSFARSKVVLGFPIEPMLASASLPPVRAHFLSFGGDPAAWLPPYAGAVSSLPALTAKASGSGAISLAPSSDGVLRAIPLLYRIQNTLYPGFGLEALRLYADLDNLSVRVAAPEVSRHGQVPGIQGVGLGKAMFLPTATDGRVWLHFRPLAPERYLPAADLLAGKVSPALVKDHIVFVGATAKGLGDTAYSPLGELVPGIEGHVQLVEQLITGEYLLRPVWENDLVTAVLIGMTLSLAFLLARYRPVWSVALALVVVLGLFALSYWLFATRHLLLDPAYPALAVGLLFLSMMVPRYLRTEREQRWIRDAFSRYVSPNRVRYLQANPEQLELGSVYRECSFVMTDLEGFTPMMEKYPPDVLSSLLNDYLDNMIQIIFRHDGTLDRIVGDAVVALFSAPAVQPDHAARALACALEMEAYSRECRRRHQEAGIPFGRTRIGVNTGTVLLGNFGGKVMLDYRALGDPINTAARLESINGQLGTRICISEASVAQCPAFTGRPIARLVLKGKSQPIMVYEALAAAEAAEARIADYCAAYVLLETEAPEVEARFAQLAAQYPDDALIAFHAKRLASGERGSLIVMKSK